MPALVLVTVDPRTLSREALERIDDVFAVGDNADDTIRGFCETLSIAVPPLPKRQNGETVLWRRRLGAKPENFVGHPPTEKSERHVRKYAEGELGEDKSFYFRGPKKAQSAGE